MDDCIYACEQIVTQHAPSSQSSACLSLRKNPLCLANYTSLSATSVSSLPLGYQEQDERVCYSNPRHLMGRCSAIPQQWLPRRCANVWLQHNTIAIHHKFDGQRDIPESSGTGPLADAGQVEELVAVTTPPSGMAPLDGLAANHALVTLAELLNDLLTQVGRPRWCYNLMDVAVRAEDRRQEEENCFCMGFVGLSNLTLAPRRIT